MTKPPDQTHQTRSRRQPEPQGPGQRAGRPVDTTKGHRDDEKNNIDEQGDRANVAQNTSNRRSG